MNLYEYIRKAIAYQVECGNRDFVIYPFGEKGQFAKKVLNEQFGIKEKYVVDNILCKKDPSIYDIDYLKKDFLETSFQILLVADYAKKNTLEIHQQIADIITVERIVDLCSPSLYFHPWNYFGDMYMKKDLRHTTIECIQREIYHYNISGAIAEAGVYKGNTAKHINYLFPDRKLYLFDTFEGFETKDQDKEKANKRFFLSLDFSETSEELVMSKMMFPRNCIIKKGWFPQSAKNVDDKFSFVRLDMDLYDPIYAGLEFFYPKMNKGGYIAIHDCRSPNFEGAKFALLDFCKEKHLNYMCMPDELGTAVIPIGM